ncbi:small ribosomal subunit protein mS25 isoform X2 [Oryctolagus cuniculus]|uniref:small ribosomal subunit protein mS25 isoform X2 n=1 Tax=Oryctolagus cuniculus TaxID=9986 RepID=UPI0022309A67|nr:28S ribosomal protein S25, mitochondrial isoform X2 [Oryctolagus cuniculus]
MPMKGRFPIRRTLQYLGQGNVVFKDSVKVMTVNYNTRGELGEGARKFVFFNIPQIQYRNPWVQITMFKNMTPSPFLRFYLGRVTDNERDREVFLLLVYSPDGRYGRSYRSYADPKPGARLRGAGPGGHGNQEQQGDHGAHPKNLGEE